MQFDVFRSNVRDEIQNISFPSSLCTGGGRGASCQQAANVGREIRQGANFGIRSTPLAPLTLDAHYSYIDRSIEGTTGAFPTGTPRHKTVGTATVHMPWGTTGILSAKYASGIVAMSDNNRPLPAARFATFDIGGSAPIRAGMVIQGGIKNLLDRNYYYWEGFPQAGRNWHLNARYTF
jgi:iron complex outermembrane receptor protein